MAAPTACLRRYDPIRVDDTLSNGAEVGTGVSKRKGWEHTASSPWVKSEVSRLILCGTGLQPVLCHHAKVLQVNYTVLVDI